MVRPYDANRLLLAPEATDDALALRLRILAADRAGMVAIQDQAQVAFPNNERLANLPISQTAVILRLAGVDPRFADAGGAAFYTFASDVGLLTERGRPGPIQGANLSWASRDTLSRAYDHIVEVTVPRLVGESTEYGSAFARGLLEYAGIIVPSEEVTGDATRVAADGTSHSDAVLNLLDYAQTSHERLIVAINGV